MICPICKNTAEAFLPYGIIPRPNALCPTCGALERHRLLWLYLQEKTNFFLESNRVLDVAPSNCLSVRWEKIFHENYVSIDLLSPQAKIKMDITDLKFKDNSFDWIICYHVLEHVPDDGKAMSELLRVLKPGGSAIIQVPVFAGPTYEDPAIVTPEERERAFGQSDHIRKYGSDYSDRLRRAGFSLKIDGYVKDQGLETIRNYGLPYYEDIYLCTK